MTRPVVGIVCCNRTIGHDQAQAVMERYMTAAMEHADVAALLIPSLPALMTAREVAPRIDGLLLTGSPSNVEPERYGEGDAADAEGPYDPDRDTMRSEEHTSELQSLMRISYAVFCLKKKNKKHRST